MVLSLKLMGIEKPEKLNWLSLYMYILIHLRIYIYNVLLITRVNRVLSLSLYISIYIHIPIYNYNYICIG